MKTPNVQPAYGRCGGQAEQANSEVMAVWKLAFQADSDDRLPAGRDKQGACRPRQAGFLSSNCRTAPLTLALLRLDPMFNPLRNDPRFEKIVASLAPT